MQQVNIHQQKLYALAIAALAVIGLCLTWYTAGIEGYAQTQSQNGFEDWGWLTLAGVGGVVISSFLMGDKTKPYDVNTKKIALASFTAIAVGAIATYFRLQSSNGQIQVQGFIVNAKTTPGAGLWIALIAGGLGLAWVSGVLKMAPPTATTPAAPPPSSTNPPIV